MSDAPPIPEWFKSVSVYLIVPNSEEAIAFYERALGAEAITRMKGPDGKSTMHAAMRVGDSIVMLTDENPEWNAKSPATLGGSPVSMHIYTENADAMFDRAVAAGCESVAPMMDAFWGDRYGKVMDPFGHQWGFATQKEELTPEQMEQRAREWFASMG